MGVQTSHKLLQMLTTFHQHGQCPCKEGRKGSEENPFGLEVQGWGDPWCLQRDVSIPSSGLPSTWGPLHESDKLPILGTLTVQPRQSSRSDPLESVLCCVSTSPQLQLLSSSRGSRETRLPAHARKLFLLKVAASVLCWK